MNSFYFKPMDNAIATIGPGYKGHPYYQLRVNRLKDIVKKEVQLLWILILKLGKKLCV